MMFVHRFTGTIISFCFFMWFVTGLVLIYHPYPRLSDSADNARKEILPDSLPNMEKLTASVRDSVNSISVRQFLGQTLIRVSAGDSTFTQCADTSQRKHKVTFADIETIARRWVDEKPANVDTLHKRAQWILYERYERAMPIYKFTYNDADGHELFISGKTGSVQQFTDRNQRFWAWIGAIPHKLYFPIIRENVDVWKAFITTGGILCLLASLSGFCIGIYIQTKNRKRTHSWHNPFKRFVYRWHHLLGLIFGIFLIGWGISGSLAMQKMPKWIVPYKGEYSMYAPDIWEDDSLDLSTFKLDYVTLKRAYPALKEVKWTTIGEKPVYDIVTDSTELFIDASTEVVKQLEVIPQSVTNRIKKVYGKDVNFTIEKMYDYDEYYLSYDGDLELPVYKVNIDDEDGSRLYIGVHNDYVRYFNHNKMARKWMFSALHYLNYKWLVERPVLWHTSIWILCLGGALVSLTGMWLGIKYIKRSISSH